MSDLIKREDAIRELERSSVYKWSVEEDQLAHNWAISIIESLPSAETHGVCLDLIRREDAIKVISNRICDNKWVCECAINSLPSAEPQGDLISREDAIEAVASADATDGTVKVFTGRQVNGILSALPSADAEWIPCNKQMPDELEAVNITWVNHNPPPYYKHIEDVPLVDSAVYYRGKWYWWHATVIDVLAEYGEDCNAEQIDKDIEILAWMLLPKPYKGAVK